MKTSGRAKDAPLVLRQFCVGELVKQVTFCFFFFSFQSSLRKSVAGQSFCETWQGPLSKDSFAVSGKLPVYNVFSGYKLNILKLNSPVVKYCE